MKLKSKLIATIVSICAAIAVMGVGVWAATASFQVTVTNKVNIAVTNFSGVVTVSTSAQRQQKGEDALSSLTGLQTAPIVELTGVKIFDSNDTTGTIANGTATIASAGAEHPYNGADLFTGTYINGETKKATLTYTFEYTPAGAGVGYTNVVINAVSLPKMAEGIAAEMTYQFKVTNATLGYDSTLQTLQLGETKIAAAAGVGFTIEIVATYSNPNMVSTVLQGTDGVDLDYEFSILYESDANREGDIIVAAPTQG